MVLPGHFYQTEREREKIFSETRNPRKKKKRCRASELITNIFFYVYTHPQNSVRTLLTSPSRRSVGGHDVWKRGCEMMFDQLDVFSMGHGVAGCLQAIQPDILLQRLKFQFLKIDV